MKSVWTKFNITIKAESEIINDHAESSILEEYTRLFEEELEDLVNKYKLVTGCSITLEQETESVIK